MTKKEIEAKVNELMKIKYKFELIEDTDEGGYGISYPDLPGCISFGKTVETAIENGEDARREWLYAMIEDGKKILEPFGADEYSGQFRLRMPKSLHKHLVERSKEEGISMNQYCVYILSQA